MGFLLLQYEFQRANREANLCNRKSVRINNQLTRATKRVEKMESIFSKAKSSLDSEYSNKKSAMTQQLSALATSINAAGGGTADAAAEAQNTMNAQLANMEIGGVKLSNYVKVNINVTDTSDASKVNSQILSQLNSAISQATQAISLLIEEAKTADEAALEDQQDKQLQPLSDKEADLEAEQSLNDTLTTLWEQRRDNAKQKLPDAIENATGHFGLK
jgi:enamine deaminase RidA (YjgF/YER057c/UK114 family)